MLDHFNLRSAHEDDADSLAQEDAVLIYSIVGLGHVLLPLILYVAIATPASYRVTTKFMTQIFGGVWWPTVIAWICTLFIDSPQIREIYAMAVTISLGGPFFTYWIVFADLLLIAADAKWMGLDWSWYILFSLFFVWTIGSIYFQAVFVPTIYDWVMNADFVESVIEEK